MILLEMPKERRRMVERMGNLCVKRKNSIANVQKASYLLRSLRRKEKMEQNFMNYTTRGSERIFKYTTDMQDVHLKSVVT